MDKIEVGEVFTISDENDQEMEVEVLASAEVDGNQYAAVSFVEDLEEDTEEDIDVFFLKLDEDGDFTPIESDEEFNRVSAVFEEMIHEE
ncbi:DUF1292 domain-containing protein [Cytobacillus firmus]|uniref:Uncharacterized protein n=1 Tax=Cytobacillus firmus TaxID=1399 RepID=A0A380XPB8_CYTFI|nr:DUF1292 domain-containing protein [Cytobacillus firmus]KAF0821798.1 hypothetical protein KIS1582_4419 [Cytobacillus firmus]MBG9543274.1 cyclopropane-fatty-acyl-phospholipid synthase [Cytobacillus firmus]MBG9550559.1 cyclopropane-fatty-acyl-phospholipid synthase [Cytobacillus firmus]MBG9553955.1 cyclopropane-fatty-acyl-phospholipid synthase [Cytobacillus firmus]MBG9558634.1 cyclopropane-fatty-acyl-phospholipid synthase [Cytobacillus firmus]